MVDYTDGLPWRVRRQGMVFGLGIGGLMKLLSETRQRLERVERDKTEAPIGGENQ
jgi:hypothetical protein